MTKEDLKKALREIISHKANLRKFSAYFYGDAQRMSKDDFIDWVVNLIYSDAMLDALNANMQLVSVCDLTCFGVDMDRERVPFIEETLLKEHIMPKVWSKPMVLLGKYKSPVDGSYEDTAFANGPTFYLDEDGAIKYIYEYELAYSVGNLPGRECPIVTYRKLHNKTKEEVWMNSIYSVLPFWMKDWWDIEE